MAKAGVFIIALIVLVVVVAAFFLLQEQEEPSLIITVSDDNQQESSPETGQQEPESQQQSPRIREFTIRESNFKLNPSTITVNEGDTVKITVINDGGSHNLFIEEYNERTDVVSSGNTRVLEFVADKTGTFNMWCEVSGHRSLGMEGTLVVE